MNTERILQVADAIEQHSIPWLGFNMNFFMADSYSVVLEETRVDNSGHDCGTIACIGGWTKAIKDQMETPLSLSYWSGEGEEAADWLGLTDVQQGQLFTPYEGPEDDWNKITQEQAIRTLRHLAATGDVDWTV